MGILEHEWRVTSEPCGGFPWTLTLPLSVTNHFRPFTFIHLPSHLIFFFFFLECVFNKGPCHSEEVCSLTFPLGNKYDEKCYFMK